MTIVEERAALEQAPIKDLVEMQRSKLRQTLSRASKSPLYRSVWRAAGVDPSQVRELENLAQLPFVTRNQLFDATRKMPHEVSCCERTTWFAGSSPTNSYEWFPFNERDFLGIANMLGRMARVVGLRTGDIVLAVVDPLPRISSVIPLLWNYSQASKVPRLEFITASLEWYETMGSTWIHFMRRRRPTVLFTSTQNAVSLTNMIRRELKLLAKEVLTETRVGIFFGEPLKASRDRIAQEYALEPYESYSPTEHSSFCTECDAHVGIHVWMDTCIPEIIPVDSRGTALPLWESPSGTMGELVITNFGECLPLIRFKTGESIRVEATDRCTCGRTHPRITRLQTDDSVQAYVSR